MLFKNKFILLMLLVGNYFSFSLQAMHGFSNKKRNISIKKYKPNTRYYKKYKNFNVKHNSKSKAILADLILFGLGVAAFEDIYTNHLENIVNTSILDFLETKAGKELVDEWAQKMTQSMIQSIDVSHLVNVEPLSKMMLRTSLKHSFVVNIANGKPLNTTLLFIPNKGANDTINGILNTNVAKEKSKIIIDPLQEITEEKIKTLINSKEFHDASVELIRSLILYSFSPASFEIPKEIIEVFSEEISMLRELASQYSYVTAVKVAPVVMSPYLSAVNYFNPLRAVAISTAGTMIPLSLVLNYCDKESTMEFIKNGIDYTHQFKQSNPHIFNYGKNFLQKYEEGYLSENFLSKEESIVSALKDSTHNTLKSVEKGIEEKVKYYTKGAIYALKTCNNVRPIGIRQIFNTIKTKED